MAEGQKLPNPAWMRRQLLRWYGRHRRRLPWRAEAGERVNAYQVWVSEIMLQQTRVAAVIPYYERFLQRYPDASALARAPEADVLAAWSGLGYYRRARQLQAAAKIIAERHGGLFPMEAAAARALPGIGEYTAGAILSIAGGIPLPAVDGNGLRIARRLTGRAVELRQARALWAKWVAPRRAGAFNQAVMDLGATVCTPRAPRCEACPLRRACRSRGAVPVAGPRPASRAVTAHYGWLQRGGKIWLCQRPATARQMPNLWELPAVTSHNGAAPLLTLLHTITNSRIAAHVYSMRAPVGNGRWFTREQALAAPLTGLARKVLLRLWPSPATPLQAADKSATSFPGRDRFPR